MQTKYLMTGIVVEAIQWKNNHEDVLNWFIAQDRTGETWWESSDNNENIFMILTTKGYKMEVPYGYYIIKEKDSRKGFSVVNSGYFKTRFIPLDTTDDCEEDICL